MVGPHSETSECVDLAVVLKMFQAGDRLIFVSVLVMYHVVVKPLIFRLYVSGEGPRVIRANNDERNILLFLFPLYPCP